MSSATVANLMRGHIEKLAAQGKRTDGRGANEFRGVSIETGLIGTAEGSSRVSLGDTTEAAGRYHGQVHGVFSLMMEMTVRALLPRL